ncbi:MAG: hypothetical protein ACPLRW_07060 [Moorellales bacterium]
MTREEFAELHNEFVARETDLLGLKAKEYSDGDDRLWNFRVQAALEGRRPSEIALSHLNKHITSICLAVRTDRGEWVWRTAEGHEGLKQRFADARNYLLLLAACLEEERGGEGNRS